MKPANSRKYLLLFTFYLLTLGSFSQTKYTLTGTVKIENGETLPGATIIIQETGVGMSSDVFGKFSFTLEEGSYTLEISFIGYVKTTKRINLTKNQKVTIVLRDENIEIEEFQVYGTRTDNTESVRMSDISLNMKQIKQIPQFMGEVDIIKTLQFLPGVSSASEGASGFYVRGGGPDQNLILLDDAVIYNSSHLFGFFSVFNSFSIDNVTLIKGGMPAKYGGRLSSVLDISQRQGSKESCGV